MSVRNEQFMLSDDIRVFLQERRFAVLATIGADGVPQQTVMWYDLLDEYVLMNTMRGRVKDRHLRRDNRASICIEDGYRYVTISGTVELDDTPEIAQRDIARLARRYNTDNPESQIASFRQQQRVSLRLSIDDVVSSGFDS